MPAEDRVQYRMPIRGSFTPQYIHQPPHCVQSHSVSEIISVEKSIPHNTFHLPSSFFNLSIQSHSFISIPSCSSPWSHQSNGPVIPGEELSNFTSTAIHNLANRLSDRPSLPSSTFDPRPKDSRRSIQCQVCLHRSPQPPHSIWPVPIQPTRLSSTT